MISCVWWGIEALHVAADIAVIGAVIVGLMEYSGHRRERRERTAAVDAHIRALAIQARLRIVQEHRRKTLREIVETLVTRGATPGDLMATWLTTMAAEAPHASPELRRAASAAARQFFELADRVEQWRARLDGGIPENDADLARRLRPGIGPLLTS